MSELNWHKLYCGHVSPEEVQRAVHNEEWQELRKSLKGKSLEYKYRSLIDYLGDKSVLYFHGQIDREEFRMVKVRITNYVTALSRGGLIKPNDYR